jgi:hypothetical protein
MHDGAQACYLGTRSVWIVLSVLGAAILLHALWRSSGKAEPDPIRESGPIL